jgi:predicted PurR-regulated permease PerM
VGSALVWLPVGTVLALSGRTGAAMAIFVVGCVVSLVDNFVRPVLSRHAQLKLPTFAVFLSMIGGIAAFGPLGLLLGPLFVRLAAEGLSLLREERGSGP